jgi:predicted O-linked N-acetylglucosamine transferase (SPINDLY family)
MQSSTIQQLQARLQANPGDPELHYDLGNLLLEAGQAVAAEASFEQAARLAPDHPQILLQLGNALSAQGRFADAATYFMQSLKADFAQLAAHFNLGNALREMGKPDQAAVCYREALRLAPNDADTHNNLGNVLREMGRLDEAIACYREALHLNPKLHHARAHLLHQRQHICDWDGLDEEIAEIRRVVAQEPQAQISPFAFLAMPGTSATEQRRCAENWVANRYQSMIAEGKRLNYQHHRHTKTKLKIGYLAADFRRHPLASLITELIELHDRSRFESHAYSYAPDDGSPERKRLEQAFDYFHDILPITQYQAAEQIYSDGIDILVDLTGFTQTSRSGILALRPAPIQVNWLGFPGTMGAPFIDYMLTDRIIVPPEQAQHYSEQLVYLADSYQPNDRKRAVGLAPKRTDCGLPEAATVFCCFNQTFKITLQVFDIWLNILNEIPGGVLWLLECNRWAKANLLQLAQARGIAPSRVIFAPRVSGAEHLARQKLADLFLDTLPYNAHTTTSDALWVGLPVLTCRGDTFAARVASSLLEAAGLPEMVTHDLASYQARALHLARHPAELQLLRQKLESSRDNMALFDTPRFARNLESAYQGMWESWLKTA